jgi:signal transduction histidine kinase
MWYEESPAGLTLIYTDDGVGIPADSKESIFVRDVAKGSGFSLYFIHDILEFSGMSIRESGEPGQGARFEIAVPKGSYRAGAKK